MKVHSSYLGLKFISIQHVKRLFNDFNLLYKLQECKNNFHILSISIIDLLYTMNTDNPTEKAAYRMDICLPLTSVALVLPVSAIYSILILEIVGIAKS